MAGFSPELHPRVDVLVVIDGKRLCNTVVLPAKHCAHVTCFPACGLDLK